MTITAKYAGHCAKCGQRIAVGERIEWAKGRTTQHAACPASATRQALPTGCPICHGNHRSVWPTCGVCGVCVYPSSDNLAAVGPNPHYGKLPGQPSAITEFRCVAHHN